ncbi:MAG: glycosyltransferase [Bacillus sp. (in: Bacteria)]|nr:glycosyltransferase [Bacillus sp. (in: firmicutes)]
MSDTKSNANKRKKKDKNQYLQKSNNPSSSHQNQDIEVSIIIPSHNRYPLNLLTLHSLEQQTFNLSKMEVIFINDASTDQTEENLNEYSPPYHLNYIHSQEKLGRARVRNLGVRSAKGSLLIFLDAEMITEPNFVENHYKYHQSKDNVILSGVMHSNAIYSCIFPEFSELKVNKIASLTKKNQVLNSRFNDFKYPCKEPFLLIEKCDITKKAFMDLAVNANPWFKLITRDFDADLEGFAFPWMAFLTGNVSLRKEFIEQAGLFDEDFFHYGYEDWELGYRLYKMGAKYIVSNEVITYHQEHPVGDSKWQEAIGNFGLFTVKHQDVDVLILGLELSRLVDLLTMSKVLNEYKLLVQSNPVRFQKFQENFITILETIVLLLNVDIRHINILGAAGFGTNDRKELHEEINHIKSQNKFTNLTYFLEKVIKS